MAIFDQYISYGKYVGNDGAIITFLEGYVSSDMISGFLIICLAACVYLFVRDMKKEGIKAVGLPIGIALIVISFLFDKIYATGLLYATIVVLSAFFVWRARSLSQGGFLGLIAIMIGISYLMFGNIATLPVFGGIGAIAFFVVKSGIKRKERGSAAEQKIARSAGYDFTPEQKAISMEHKAERKAHSEGKEGKITEESGELEERNISEQIHAGALAAGVEDISKKITELDNAELTIRQRDKKILEFSEAVNNHIKKIGLENTDDTTKANELKQTVMEKIKAIKGLVEDQIASEKYLEKTQKGIEQTTKAIKDAATFARTIIDFEIKDTKELEHRLNPYIGQIKSDITRKENQLSRMKDKAQSDQKGKINSEIDMLKKTFNTADKLKSDIIGALERGKHALAAVKSESKKVIETEKEMENFEKNIHLLEAHMGTSITEIQEAFKKFEREVNQISKDSLPEEISITAKTDIAKIYAAINKYLAQMIEINQKQILPFIQDTAKMLQETWRIEKASDFQNKVNKYISDAIEQITKISALTTSHQERIKDIQNVARIAEVEEQIAKYADRKSDKIQKDMKQSYDDLNKAILSVQEQIKMLEEEQRRMQNAAKEDDEAFNTINSQLHNIRKKQFEQIQDAAKRAERDVSKAEAAERAEKRAS